MNIENKKGKYIFSEIQLRDKTKRMIEDRKNKLQSLQHDYENMMDVNTVRYDNFIQKDNYIDKASIANDILSDQLNVEKEISFLELQLEYRNRLYNSVINYYDGAERALLADYFSGKYANEKLKIKYYDSHPYKKVIRLLDNADIELL